MKKILIVGMCILLVFGLSGCNQNNHQYTVIPSPTQPLQTATISPLDPTKAPADNTDKLSEYNDIIKYPIKPVFNIETFTEKESLPFKPLSYDKNVSSYKVNANLSNIENLDQFGEFTSAQKQKLVQNHFFVAPSNTLQLFNIYEQNEYLKVPSFITVDSVLQVYHIFFDYSLRTLEADMLLPDLELLTDSMLRKSMVLYNTAENTDVKKAATKNVAFFLVAQKALGLELPNDVPNEALDLAENEYQKVLDSEGFIYSELTDSDIDYSQFTVRGHYTRNNDLQRYFIAMMWYGLIPFPLLNSDNSGNDEGTVQALLMTYSLFLPVNRDRQDIELWKSIYEPTVFYVGKADDLCIYEYMDLLTKAYGENPDINSLFDKEKLNVVYKEAEDLRVPGIQTAFITVNSPSDKQFRFMGQRYIPDSEILQRLVKSTVRNIPSGLDVMAVLGSDEAHDLLINTLKVPVIWSEYPEKFNEVKGKFDDLPQSVWQSNMYYGWLWTLKPLLGTYGNGYPDFMNKSAWHYKSLNTALASWAELRHDTILYGKQSGAECGGDWPPPVIKSYVEPNVEVYERLLWLTRYSSENLSAKGILPENLKYKLSQFEDLLTFLIECSVKELRNEELTVDEYNTLLIYGGNLEYLTLSMAEGPILSETDRNMAVIADIHTTPGAYLEAGVGPASEIFVIVPIAGKLYLTRGAVFSYYEFISDKRLTDEQWQNLFKEGKEPSPPMWTEIFMEGEKGEIPVPAEPFNSGC